MITERFIVTQQNHEISVILVFGNATVGVVTIAISRCFPCYIPIYLAIFCYKVC